MFIVTCIRPVLACPLPVSEGLGRLQGRVICPSTGDRERPQEILYHTIEKRFNLELKALFGKMILHPI